MDKLRNYILGGIGYFLNGTVKTIGYFLERYKRIPKYRRQNSISSFNETSDELNGYKAKVRSLETQLDRTKEESNRRLKTAGQALKWARERAAGLEEQVEIEIQNAQDTADSYNEQLREAVDKINRRLGESYRKELDGMEKTYARLERRLRGGKKKRSEKYRRLMERLETRASDAIKQQRHLQGRLKETEKLIIQMSEEEFNRYEQLNLMVLYLDKDLKPYQATSAFLEKFGVQDAKDVDISKFSYNLNKKGHPMIFEGTGEYLDCRSVQSSDDNGLINILLFSINIRESRWQKIKTGLRRHLHKKDATLDDALSNESARLQPDS